MDNVNQGSGQETAGDVLKEGRTNLESVSPNTAAKIVKELNVAQESAKFKAELKKLSHNELARQACEFYTRLILCYAKIDQLESELGKLKESK